MASGTVKWFNPNKGYGFIESADGTGDVFVHISAVEQAGLSTLNEGQKLEFEVVTGRNGKSAAENLVASQVAAFGHHLCCYSCPNCNLGEKVLRG